MQAEAAIGGAAEQQQTVGAVGGESEGELLLGQPGLQA
jgi:hypothetical protein